MFGGEPYKNQNMARCVQISAKNSLLSPGSATSYPITQILFLLENPNKRQITSGFSSEMCLQMR